MSAALHPKFISTVLVLVAIRTFAQTGPLVATDLILDLNAEHDVVTDHENRVLSWKNQSTFMGVDYFVDQDSLRAAVVEDPKRHSWGWYQGPRDKNGVEQDSNPTASGKPMLIEHIAALNGHSAIEFLHDELHNDDPDAFDGFHAEQGYTWFVVIKVDKNQRIKEKGLNNPPNAFFGNLQNSADPKPNEGKYYAGFFGGVYDGLGIYGTSRNGLTFRDPLHTPRPDAKLNCDWNIVAFRQGAGRDGEDVALELFVNGVNSPDASTPYRISNAQADSSIMVIGQERRAINHFGSEAFRGQIARFLIYKKPLNSSEMKDTYNYLQALYLE